EALRTDPHLAAVGMFATMTHPSEGSVTVTRPPLRFARTPAAIRRLAPGLGAHNAEIFVEGETP
ncbi:MAG: CoA transferase, partial [Rhodospirillales bacterium]|nr:CoA transferase [Rhodospirillales bacterium]